MKLAISILFFFAGGAMARGALLPTVERGYCDPDTEDKFRQNYAIHQDSINWDDAVKTCGSISSVKMEPVTINDAAELKLISDYFKGCTDESGEYWTSGNARQEEGDNHPVLYWGNTFNKVPGNNETWFPWADKHPGIITGKSRVTLDSRHGTSMKVINEGLAYQPVLCEVSPPPC